MWQTPATDVATFGDASKRVADALRIGGYGEVRRYPIGAFYRHGFIVTTRLEATYEDGRPKPPTERWSSSYPEAANLTWLAEARRPLLPGVGHYRTLVVAFTDLPLRAGDAAMHDNEWTVMNGPDLPASPFPSGRHVSAGFDLAVYVYEYQAVAADCEGEFIPSDPTLAISLALGTP
jgi:hypothetical protein